MINICMSYMFCVHFIAVIFLGGLCSTPRRMGTGLQFSTTLGPSPQSQSLVQGHSLDYFILLLLIELMTAPPPPPHDRPMDVQRTDKPTEKLKSH